MTFWGAFMIGGTAGLGVLALAITVGERVQRIRARLHELDARGRW